MGQAQGHVWGIHVCSRNNIRNSTPAKTVARTCCRGMSPWVVILQSMCNVGFKGYLAQQYLATASYMLLQPVTAAPYVGTLN